MAGWFRWFYYYLNWEYYDHWEARQKHLKYLLTEQIKHSHLELKPLADDHDDEMASVNSWKNRS